MLCVISLMRLSPLIALWESGAFLLEIIAGDPINARDVCTSP